MLRISTRKERLSTVLAVQGPLDGQNAPQLQNALNVLYRTGKSRVVLDCHEVDSLTSQSVGVLCQFADYFREEGGELCLAQLPERPKRVLEHLNLGAYLRVYDSLDDAVEQEGG